MITTTKWQNVFLTVTILFLKLWEFLSWKATARRPGIGISKSSVLAACKFSAVLAMQLLLISNWIVGNPYGIILPTRYDDKVDYLLDLNLFAPSGAGHRPNVAILVCLVQQLPPVSSSFHYPVFLCPDFISMCSWVFFCNVRLASSTETFVLFDLFVCPHSFVFPWAVQSSPLQFLALA